MIHCLVTISQIHAMTAGRPASRNYFPVSGVENLIIFSVEGIMAEVDGEARCPKKRAAVRHSIAIGRS